MWVEELSFVKKGAAENRKHTNLYLDSSPAISKYIENWIANSFSQQFNLMYTAHKILHHVFLIKLDH